MSRGVLPTQAYAMQNVQNLQKQEDAVQGAHSVTTQNMSTSHQFQTGPLTRLRGQQFQQRIVQQHQHTPMQNQVVDSLGNPEQLGEQIALAERQIEENRRKLSMYSPFQGQTQHVPQNVNIQQLQTAKKEQAQVLKPVSYNMKKMQIPNKVRGNVSTQSPQSKTDVKLANSTGAPKRTIQQTKPRVIALSNKRRKMCVQPESQNHTLSQSNNYQQIGNQNIPVIKGSNPASANMCQTIPTNQNRKTHPQNNSYTDWEVIPGKRVELKGGGKFEEGQIYMVNNRKGQEKKMIWKGGELVNFKSTHTRETPFTEAFSTASTGPQYQTVRETKVVNTDRSRTLYFNPGNQPPGLANVSMKQPGSPMMSRGVVPTQVYARRNVQNLPKQVHVAAVPNGHGGQSATNQNMSSSQQFQTGRLPFQLSQQRIVQQHQHTPLQDQAVDLQGNPKQLNEQIALAEGQFEENRRKLLSWYSQIQGQTQHVPHNANIQQLKTAKKEQAQGLKPAGYNMNKMQIPNKVRDNVSTQSPQTKTDVKLANSTGASNRTIQQTKSQVIAPSNKRRKMCVQPESQNHTLSQSNNFQQIGNQNIPVIKGSNPASANMCQTIPTNQNRKTHPQNNSYTDWEVIPGKRVELKGGGKFEEGQIYMVRNREGQEKKMILKSGGLVNFKSNVVPDGDKKKEGSKMKSSSVQECRLKIFDLEKENKELKEQRLCKICMESDANVVFLPCGHLVSCQYCAPPLKLCPICREVINKTVRTYLS